MVKRALVALFIVVLSQGCGMCMCAGSYSDPQGTESAYAEDDAVFIGEVDNIEVKDCREAIIHFKVDKIYKGDRVETMEVSGFGAMYEPSCHMSVTDQFVFEQGKTYLVYANRTNGTLYTGGCSRTRELSEAGQDVQALDSLLAAAE